MTKKYDIIHLNGFMYAVDRNPIKVGSTFSLLGTNLFDGFDKVGKIMATNDPSLGLPLLPEIEEDINNIFEKASKSNLFENDLIYNIGNKPEAYYIAKRIFIEGYKAASAKKYTEEDLRKAFLEGWNHEDGGEKLLTHTWQELLQSLNPLPIAVEIEMYQNPDNGNPAFGGYDVPDVPLVDENNFVKVVKWIYEKEKI